MTIEEMAELEALLEKARKSLEINQIQPEYIGFHQGGRMYGLILDGVKGTVTKSHSYEGQIFSEKIAING